MKKLISVVALLLASLPALQAQNTALFPGEVPGFEDLLVVMNNARDTLVSAITSGSTSIVLTDATEFFSPGVNEAAVIQIGSEYIRYCSKSGNTLTVCSDGKGGRGFDGSSAASHGAGSIVIDPVIAHTHNQVAAELLEALETLGPVVPVASLPSSPSDGDMARVTDGASSTDCTVGGGSELVPCIYDSGAGAWVDIGGGATLTQEQVEDFVGGMVSGNTETLITVTYEDSDGTLDFVVNEAAINLANLTGTLGTGQAASGFTLDTEWDTLAEIETVISYDFSSAANLDTGTLPAARIDLTATYAYTGTIDLSGGIAFVPSSTTLPATCSVGQAYMDTNATSGQRWFLCEATDTWVQQGGSSSIDISDDTNLAVTAPITLTGDTVGFDNDDLALTGNLTLTDATNPIFQVQDSTGPVTGAFAATNTVVQVGTTTDHTLQIVANSVPRIDIETDDDMVFGSGSQSDMTWSFDLTAGDSSMTVSNNQINFTVGTLSHNAAVVVAEGGSHELGQTTFGSALSESSQYSVANTDGYSIRDTTLTTSGSELDFTKLRGSGAANDNDDMGYIRFFAKDDNDVAFATTQFARITAVATDVSDATQDARLDFLTMFNGTLAAALSVDSSIQLYDRGTKPTCAVGEIFRVWVDNDATDTAEICLDEGGGYAWTSLVGAGGGASVTDDRIPLLKGTSPWPGGRVYKDTLNTVTTNGAWRTFTNVFTNSDTRECLYGTAEIPATFSSNPSIRVVWGTPATAGNVPFDFDYFTVGGNDTESIDQGEEILDERDFATHVEWDTAGDFDDTGGDCGYSHSTGSGTCTQVAADQLGTAANSTLYRFIFTIKAFSGDVDCNITTAFAASTTDLPMVVGTHAVVFQSAASVGDFVISCTSTSGTADFDDVSLIAGITESVTVTDTAGSAAWERMETEITVTGGNFAAGDTMYYGFCRDDNDSADTLADLVVVEEALFEFDH